uniref:Uncharacterized protein n=1 Tax=Fibrocapsa japonica TaxID=94617 RepID=A0A7S2V2L2_9STRA|mmetsp:Transcript_22296/g.32376  ORF Transcript_22296/g.32376 Transcript_22296/m.32376 type:complete len:110 (+) Transcript_22296:120-449(+)|eukprot:CAMPEP_0113943370 /NCGR_PEP_ID=MMETSP1339-20121228/23213_1 /TAXON_ID=94617 /ORGANISM="Fibrocapsa japonica" /LENGTH=109 /DNA_ID=CAMNT_0000948221 /DNA_START=35 /DNA_END=364 /DNA_ORIENTATION=- /assembly_acc=CAM_ASM_000762
MDETEFGRKLSQFPVVRDRNYHKIQWKKDNPAQQNDFETSKKKNDQPAVTDISEERCNDFWSALDELLVTSYPVAQAKRIKDEFKKMHKKNVNSFCLEDVEDVLSLCAT